MLLIQPPYVFLEFSVVFKTTVYSRYPGCSICGEKISTIIIDYLLSEIDYFFQNSFFGIPAIIAFQHILDCPLLLLLFGKLLRPLHTF